MINIDGNLIEVGNIAPTHQIPGVVIKRDNGTYIAIQGITEDEARSLAKFFLEPVSITIEGNGTGKYQKEENGQS